MAETINPRFYATLSPTVRQFMTEAMPFSNWGQTYFDIRLMELALADSMFGNVFTTGGRRALDLGCGIGVASVFLADYFACVDGTDIEELGVAFRIDRPAPIVGTELLTRLAFNRVQLHCGDTLAFLAERPDSYDFIFSHFVMEHVPELNPLCTAMYDALRPGARTFHIVPNTHDTVNQLLMRNLQPIWPNIKQAWQNRKNKQRCEGRLQGALFTPLTHSEFLSDYRDQFEVNSSDRYLFPLIGAGFRILDMKPMREHAYGILAQKP
jgi:SAM-dependent methyltransferase